MSARQLARISNDFEPAVQTYDPADWLTMAEAAKLTGLTVAAISNFCKGPLQSRWFGAYRYIARTDAEAFVERLRRPARSLCGHPSCPFGCRAAGS